MEQYVVGSDSSYIIGISGIIIGIISIVIALAPLIYKRFKEVRSPYTGIWEDRIYDDNNNVIKRDIFYLKQNGNEIIGTAKRIFPKDQNHRRYEVYGKLLGRDFVAIFWATDQSILSYGCWFITQRNDTTFVGSYLRMSKKDYSRRSTCAELIRSELNVKDFNRIK